MSDPIPAAPTGRPFIFYSAHQDDETLWAGRILAHHALAGRTMFLVLGTDGSTTAIRNNLNGITSNYWWGAPHYPAREQIPTLQPADIAVARDKEFIAAGTQLGVPAANIHLRVAERTSAVTVAEAKALIESYQAQHPTAGHWTTHWTDSDVNHAALGQALRELALADPATYSDARWVVRHQQQGTVAGEVTYVVPTQYQAEADRMVEHACRAYGAWNPQAGLYAIGYHSVAQNFDLVTGGRANSYVKFPS